MQGHEVVEREGGDGGVGEGGEGMGVVRRVVVRFGVVVAAEEGGECFWSS